MPRRANNVLGWSVLEIIYLFFVAGVFGWLLLQSQKKRKKQPFDWSRKHTRWSRLRARSAFPHDR